MTEVHVIPDERTTWRVHDGDAAAPLSEHGNATEAELAARAPTEDRNAERIVVHDRYHRTHDAPGPSRAWRHANSSPTHASWRASVNALASSPAPPYTRAESAGSPTA